MNIGFLLAAGLDQTAPILLAALAALFTYKANILNIAVEGMMLVAAFVAIAVGVSTGSATLAVLAAVLAATTMSALYGALVVGLRTDFVVAGIGINLLASGLTVFILEQGYGSPGGLRPVLFPDLYATRWLWLRQIPWIGPGLYGRSIIVWVSLLLVPLASLLLYRTPLGSNIRAVGEDEGAARAAGIRVAQTKFIAVLISGVLAGLAGAEVSMDKLHFFLPEMSAGRGFIGLAAMLFGAGTPFRSAGASLLFGLAGAAANRLQTVQLPSELVLMVPYVAAVLGITISKVRTRRRSRVFGPAPDTEPHAQPT